MTSTRHHQIAIVGAGLSGLVLARILHVNGVDAAVYDAEALATTRPQGGMLDIHEETGQAALRAAGLFDEFTSIIQEGGEAMRILDQHATIRMQDQGSGTRPEVNRRTLRDLLIGSLPEGMIRWGSKVTGATEIGAGRHEVTLAEGSTFTTDLLIGADGAWSKIRPLVSDSTPEYSGISFVEAHLVDADTRHPASAAVVGPGLLFALGDEKGFIAHRDPDGRLHVYIALKAPAEWLRGIDFADGDVTRAVLLEMFTGWDSALQGLITGADGDLVPRQIHALPVGHRWDGQSGVTLVGDAAHLMSPFAGEGANLAMYDGAELAQAILAHPGDSATALASYEQDMFSRSESAAAESADNLVVSFRPDAPQGLLDVMAGHAA